MNNYEERREARIERLRERAEQARQESQAAYERSNAAVAGIPMGQPILIGHHSEKRHRAALKRCHAAMDASCAALDKARELERRALAAEKNTAISSDDPEALAKLTEKLENLRGQQEFYKAVNAAYRAWKKKPESLEETGFSDRVKEQIRNWKPTYSFDKQPMPPYLLSNNNANIKRVEERIQQLQARGSATTTEEMVGAVRIVDNVEANRVQAFFPDKPVDEVRAMLKARGFRWAPSEGAWQAFRGNGALWSAREIAKKAEVTG
jgi:hypothetical protein